MSVATSKLPQEAKPLKFDPDLAAAIGALLEPLSGKALDRAQKAVVTVRKSGICGTFHEIVAAYQAAIAKAATK